MPVHIANEALQRLAERETYLYGGNGRYWYDTRPNLNRTAEENAARVPAHEVVDEIKRRLETERSSVRGPIDNPFAGVHVFVGSGDVPDDGQVRLVVLPPEATHASAGSSSPARVAALAMLEQRGTMPRLAKNMLVYLVPDAEGMASLERAVRQYLAWSEIKQREEELNLDAHGRRQARENAERSNQTAESRLGEAYKWLIVPRQSPGGEWELAFHSIAGMQPFVRRVTAALRKDQVLVEALNPKLLQMTVDRWFWNDQPHVDVKRLWETFANYGYMDRLRDARVLQEAIAEGVRSQDFFGYASGIGDDGRYQGLIFGGSLGPTRVTLDGQSVLIRPEVAREQLSDAPVRTTDGPPGATGVTPPPRPVGRRYFGSVEINTSRAVRDAGAILQEVVAHLTSLPQANVRVTLEIEADLPQGLPDDVQRAITENARTLGFTASEFEQR